MFSKLFPKWVLGGTKAALSSPILSVPKSVLEKYMILKEMISLR